MLLKHLYYKNDVNDLRLRRILTEDEVSIQLAPLY
jgi:hypothetical protein